MNSFASVLLFVVHSFYFGRENQCYDPRPLSVVPRTFLAQNVVAAKAMCQAMREAERAVAPLEAASTSVKSTCGGGGVARADASSSVGGKPYVGSGPADSLSVDPTSGVGGTSSYTSSAGSSLTCGDTSADAVQSRTPAPANDINPPTLVHARTRTRTNVSLSTGTLAAERGTWKLQPWRLWPVHQAAAAALVEPCLNSAIAVPELVPLRKALAALAYRTDKSLMLVDSSTANPESVGGKRGRDREAGNSGGGGGSSGSGGSVGTAGNLRGRRGGHARGSTAGGIAGGGSGGGGGGSSGSEAVVSAKSNKGFFATSTTAKGVGARGGVLVGVGHKRRRQDALATAASSLQL